MEEKKKTMISVIAILFLIILVVGISYAVYTFIGTGSKENVINIGQLSVNYSESNLISLSNQYPVSDEVGIVGTNASPNDVNQMQFSVSATISGNQTIYYAIGLDNVVKGTTLKDEYVKIYLTKGNDPATGFVAGVGETIDSFHTKSIENTINNYAILTDSFSTSGTHNYTLKAWVASNYELPNQEVTTSGTTHSNTTTSEQFKFKIKVEARDVAMSITNSSSILKTEKILTNQTVSLGVWHADQSCDDYYIGTGDTIMYFNYLQPNILVGVSGFLANDVLDREMNGDSFDTFEFDLYEDYTTSCLSYMFDNTPLINLNDLYLTNNISLLDIYNEYGMAFLIYNDNKFYLTDFIEETSGFRARIYELSETDNSNTAPQAMKVSSSYTFNSTTGKYTLNNSILSMAYDSIGKYTCTNLSTTCETMYKINQVDNNTTLIITNADIYTSQN